MRSTTRLVASFLTLFALVALSLTATGSANAADTTQRARVAHTIKFFNAGEVNNSGTFFVKGQVTTFKNKIVRLDKATCKKCKFKRFKSQRTSGTGSFRFTFDGPIGTCYRLYVPGTAQYKPAYRFAGCIVRA